MGMSIKNKLKYIFSIDTKSTNRIIIYILGIRIRHLKPGIEEAAKEYIKLDCPVGDIPKAEGTLRMVQFANLKLLEIFDKLCADNNFEYWLDYGNLLGAVRHKGFIPWDDDIDVSMMRDDYEKFIKIFKNGIPGFDDLKLEFDNNGKNKCFLKIKHTKLTNIALDVFPNDYYFSKTNDDEKKELCKILKKLTYNPFYKLLYPFYIGNPEGLRKRFIKLQSKYILKGNTVDKTIEPSVFCSIDYPHMHKNLVFDYETIFPLKKIFYEGLYFYCPNDTEKYLTMKYGNYMELPDNCYPRHVNSEAFKGDEGLKLQEFIGEKINV